MKLEVNETDSVSNSSTVTRWQEVTSFSSEATEEVRIRTRRFSNAGWKTDVEHTGRRWGSTCSPAHHNILPRLPAYIERQVDRF